jgi:hypothetical protein
MKGLPGKICLSPAKIAEAVGGVGNEARAESRCAPRKIVFNARVTA